MIPNQNIKKLAAYEASLSNHRFRVGAVIYNGNRNSVLGRGFNIGDKTHPRSPHPFRSIHAEFAAFLVAFRQRSDLHRSSIYVHRLLANGKPGLSKPCTWCMGLLNNVGIKEVYWSMEHFSIGGV